MGERFCLSGWCLDAFEQEEQPIGNQIGLTTAPTVHLPAIGYWWSPKHWHASPFPSHLTFTRTHAHPPRFFFWSKNIWKHQKKPRTGFRGGMASLLPRSNFHSWSCLFRLQNVITHWHVANILVILSLTSKTKHSTNKHIPDFNKNARPYMHVHCREEGFKTQDILTCGILRPFPHHCIGREILILCGVTTLNVFVNWKILWVAFANK